MWSNVIESIIEKGASTPTLADAEPYRILLKGLFESITKLIIQMLHCNVTHEKFHFSNNGNKGGCYTQFDRKEKRTVKEYEVKDKKLFFSHLGEDLQK